MGIFLVLGLAALGFLLFQQQRRKRALVQKPRAVNDFFAEKREGIRQKIRTIERPLFIDNQTTGLIKGRYTASDDLAKVPRTVQISWRLYQGEKLVEAKTYTIKPDRYQIPLEASAINGITTEIAMAEGTPIQEVLAELTQVLGKTDCVISHYNYFRHTIIGADYVRLGYDNPLTKMKSFDMMEEVGLLLKLNSNSFNSVINAILPSAHFENKHDAGENVEVLAKAFFQLRKSIPKIS